MVRLDDDTAATLLQVLRGLPGNEHIERLMASVREQLERPQFHGEVIDKIAQILARGNNARNIISGENLTLLRRALLSPREFAEFETSCRNGVACINCGRRIRARELTTHDGGALYCHRCVQPRYLGCNCGNFLEIDLTAKIQRTQRECPHCKEGKKAEQPAEAAAPAEDARNAVNIPWDAPQQPQFRAGGRVPRAPQPIGAVGRRAIENLQREARNMRIEQARRDFEAAGAAIRPAEPLFVPENLQMPARVFIEQDQDGNQRVVQVGQGINIPPPPPAPAVEEPQRRLERLAADWEPNPFNDGPDEF